MQFYHILTNGGTEGHKTDYNFALSNLNIKQVNMKKKYKRYCIMVYYETGDSNGSYDMHNKLEMTWNKLDVAKENLKRIKQHHQWYLYKHPEFHLSRSKKKIKRPAVVSDQHDTCFNLITDDGNECQISAFWCGYFENLDYARIEENEDPEMIYQP